MRGDSCVGCGGRPASRMREAIVRGLAHRLAAAACYPVMYRSVEALPLCAACLEKLPLIGDTICPQCGRDSKTGELCPDCQKIPAETLQSNRSLLRYNEWGKDLLGTYKYRGEERLASFYAQLLTIAVHRHYKGITFDCIQAVPLHQQRLRERGFNQVDLLARRLGDRIGVPVRSLLLRTKMTEKLSKQAGRAARESSMADAFSWAGESLKGNASGWYRVLLLDDIYTTGSTLRSCAHTIREHAGTRGSIYSLTIYR